jgi:hypothetical protein
MFSMTLAAIDVDTTNDLAMWSFLVGAFLPALVAVIQQPRWPNWFRATVTVISSVIAAGVTVWLAGDFALDSDFVGSILRVLIAAQATYIAFWKQTLAPKIEAATS